MARSLVIVESPAKAKTINKYLGKNYVVKASYGHVMDLPKKNIHKKYSVIPPDRRTKHSGPLILVPVRDSQSPAATINPTTPYPLCVALGPLRFGGGGSGSGIGLFGSGPGSAVYNNVIEDNEASGNGLAGILIHAHHPGGERAPDLAQRQLPVIEDMQQAVALHSRHRQIVSRRKAHDAANAPFRARHQQAVLVRL